MILLLVILVVVFKNSQRDKEYHSIEECEADGGIAIDMGVFYNASWDDPCPDNKQRLGIIPPSLKIVLCCR